MSFKQLIIFVLFLLFNYSCSDECEGVVCQNGGVCILGNCDCPDGFYGEFCENENLLLKAKYSNGVIVTSYEYDDERKLSNTTFYTNGEASQLSTYTYYPDSLIITPQYLNGFEPNGIQISFTKYMRTPDNEVIYELYDVENELINTVTYSSPNMDCGHELRIEGDTEISTSFTDENCSYIKEVRIVGDTILQFKEVVIRDDKNFSDESITIPYFSFPNTSNILELTSSNLFAETSFTIFYEYEYNDQGYPIKRTRMSTSTQSTSEITYEYY